MESSFIELDEQALLRKTWSGGEPFAVYFYTPWCGTCKYGEKMLTVVAAMEPSAQMYRGNVNFLPTVVREWKIESVPCLAFVQGKRLVEKIYTMRNVEHLLERVRDRLL